MLNVNPAGREEKETDISEVAKDDAVLRNTEEERASGTRSVNAGGGSDFLWCLGGKAATNRSKVRCKV